MVVLRSYFRVCELPLTGTQSPYHRPQFLHSCMFASGESLSITWTVLLKADNEKKKKKKDGVLLHGAFAVYQGRQTFLESFSRNQGRWQGPQSVEAFSLYTEGGQASQRGEWVWRTEGSWVVRCSSNLALTHESCCSSLPPLKVPVKAEKSLWACSVHKQVYSGILSWPWIYMLYIHASETVRAVLYRHWRGLVWHRLLGSQANCFTSVVSGKGLLPVSSIVILQTVWLAWKKQCVSLVVSSSFHSRNCVSAECRRNRTKDGQTIDTEQ